VDNASSGAPAFVAEGEGRLHWSLLLFYMAQTD
jgi:hypothetical protein